MDLYLVRHAVAEHRDAARWPDDRDRPLSPDGGERFRQVARGLGKIAPVVDRVLSSPLARAWQTAEILHEEIGWPEPVPFEEAEPERAPQETGRALSAHTGTGSVAVVGHEPHLSMFAAYLIAGGDAEIEIRKGGAACLSMDGVVRQGDALLRWLVTPKILRGL